MPTETEILSQAMRTLRSRNTEGQKAASRTNGKKGGRPRRTRAEIASVRETYFQRTTGTGLSGEEWEAHARKVQAELGLTAAQVQAFEDTLDNEAANAALAEDRANPKHRVRQDELFADLGL